MWQLGTVRKLVLPSGQLVGSWERRDGDADNAFKTSVPLPGLLSAQAGPRVPTLPSLRRSNSPIPLTQEDTDSDGEVNGPVLY